MTKNIECAFYTSENNTIVDTSTQKISVYECGGWERSYNITFKELLKDAKK